MSIRRVVLFFVFGVLFIHSTALAQSPATLHGTLTDPSGGGVANAEISAEPSSAAGGTPARTASGSDGHFTLTLTPGEYRIRITHPSFARAEEKVTLAAGETRELRVRLDLERLSASVVVTAQAEPATAETTSAPVSVVTRAEIEQRQATSLPNLLSTLPGFALGRTGPEGGLTSLFLNGGNSNFTKVLVDGTTINDPGGAVDFSNLTLENIEKIEVVRGAESALYGSDALAGVVQIFTHRGTTSRPQLTLLAEGGGFSSARGSATLAGLLRRFDYSAGAAYFQTAGQGPNDAFLNRTLSGNFGWRFTDTNRVRLALRNNTSDAGVAGQTLLVPANLAQHNALHNFSANLGWDFQTGPHWHHHLTGAESYQRQYFVLSPRFTVANQLNRSALLEQSSYFFRKGAVTAGYQAEVENGWLSGPHFRRNNQAGFLDMRYQPWARLTVSAGARAEANDSFGTRVVPRAGAAVLLREAQGFWGATRARFSFGLGIKEPNLGQSFGKDSCFPGNPGLRPERSRTLNAGVEQRLASDRMRISADYFENRFRDIISFAFGQSVGPPPTACPFGIGTFFNTDLARARGTNISVEAKPARWLRVSGNYTYNDSRVLKSPNAFDPALIAGNRLIRRPVHSGTVVLNAAYRRVNWNIAGYFTGARTDSDFLDRGLNRNPGYARFDLGGAFDLTRNISVFGRAENLFDKRYQDVIGFPALGRDYRAGMKFRLGGE